MSTLKLPSTSTLSILPGSSTLEIFECTLKFLSMLKYSNSDYTGISKSSRLASGLFFTALGLGIAG